MPFHTIESSECISSIALENGLFWETIWNHPQNADLKQRRKDPNILFPGDVLFIPDLELKQELRSTETHNCFVKRNNLVILRLRLLDDFKPRAGLKYTLVINGISFSGQTDGEGHLRQHIPADATGALLLTAEDAYNVDIGVLDPIMENSGVQHRLSNLGYLSEAATGEIDDATTAALSRFQKEHGLNATGDLNQETRNKLQSVHGC
ncbi:MAG: peptidoglycan-binding protein [Terriglobia bacterium]